MLNWAHMLSQKCHGQEQSFPPPKPNPKPATQHRNQTISTTHLFYAQCPPHSPSPPSPRSPLPARTSATAAASRPSPPPPQPRPPPATLSSRQRRRHRPRPRPSPPDRRSSASPATRARSRQSCLAGLREPFLIPNRRLPPAKSTGKKASSIDLGGPTFSHFFLPCLFLPSNCFWLHNISLTQHAVMRRIVGIEL
ncbi:hypothetical protein DFJ73DRAFT_792132, partial [Zopfochytrium polystomum]